MDLPSLNNRFEALLLRLKLYGCESAPYDFKNDLVTGFAYKLPKDRLYCLKIVHEDQYVWAGFLLASKSVDTSYHGLFYKNWPNSMAFDLERKSKLTPAVLNNYSRRIAKSEKLLKEKARWVNV